MEGESGEGERQARAESDGRKSRGQFVGFCFLCEEVLLAAGREGESGGFRALRREEIIWKSRCGKWVGKAVRVSWRMAWQR